MTTILGAGRFGTYLANQIEACTGVKPTLIDKGGSIPEETSTLIFCIPMRDFEAEFRPAVRNLAKNALVMDTCSVKGFAVNLMSACGRGDIKIAGTHPLFGPQSAPGTCQGHDVAICPLPREELPTEAIAFWEKLGVNTIIYSADEHDQQMANQAVDHFIGRAAAQAGITRGKLHTKTHELFMDIVEIAQSNSPELFEDFFRFNPHAEVARSRFIAAARNLAGNLRNNEPMPQTVVCAAQRRWDTKEIICGARHFDPIMQANIKALSKSDEDQAAWRGSEQGFIDQKGNFLTREEGLKIATETGQMMRRCGGDHRQLYSDNLY